MDDGRKRSKRIQRTVGSAGGRRSDVRLFLLSVAAGLLLGAVGGAYDELARLRRALSTGQQALVSASSSMSGHALTRAAAGEFDLDQACAELSTAAGAFHEAAAGADRLVPMLRLAERAEREILQRSAGTARAESSLALVALATEVSVAGDRLCRELRPLAALLRGEATGERPLVEELLGALGESRRGLEQARVHLARADLALRRVRPAELDVGTRDAVVALSGKLPMLRNSVEALLLLPELLGANGARTYLLLAQNREELRPTGGYIGTAGVVRLAGGRVEHQEFGTSVAFDLPSDRLVPPPAPLTQYLQSSYWQLRDANWWPDFPSSAEQIAYFYNEVRSEPVDGVIAFDQRTLALLLEQMGAVEVPDYGETVTSSNLQERLDYYVHGDLGRDDEWQRKVFVGALAAVVLQAMASAPAERLPAYVGAVGQALAGKYLLVYLGDPSGAQLAAELNWDGHLYQGPGDYVYVVSANVSPNKVDPYIERTAHYTVDLAASPQARLTLEVTNRFDPTATAPWPTTRYRDYLRVYVPWESQLRGATGFASAVETTAECGRTLFAGLVEVPPGEHVTLVLEYALNPAVLDGNAYTLAVQKQPGLDAIPLTVEVVGDDRHAAMHGALASDRQYRLRGGNDLVVGELPPAEAAAVACAPAKPAPMVLAPPVRMAIPRLRVDAPIGALQVRRTGEMEVPGDGEAVGWYEASARPGYAGNFVAAAHVDWAGRPGVFWGLHELRPGDHIVVSDALGRTHTYAVEWNQVVRPEDVPLRDAVGPSYDKLMTLITCTGNFNQVTRDYSHRQIVRARLVDSS